MRRHRKQTFRQLAPLVGVALVIGPHLPTLGREASQLGASVAWIFPEPPSPAVLVPLVELKTVDASPPPPPPVTAAAWFSDMRPQCSYDAVTLATDLRRPPDSTEGRGYEAACFAMAGRINKARALLLGLDHDARAEGAGLVFDVASELASEEHPAAGPLFELVVEFWPNHHLALHQAGILRYARGDAAGGRSYLVRFLEAYPEDDSLAGTARSVLGAGTGTAIAMSRGPDGV